MEEKFQYFFEKSKLSDEKKVKAKKYIPVAKQGMEDQLRSLAINYPVPVIQTYQEGVLELFEIILNHSEKIPLYTFELGNFPMQPFFNDQGWNLLQIENVLRKITLGDFDGKIKIKNREDFYELGIAEVQISNGEILCASMITRQYKDYPSKEMCKLLNSYLQLKGLEGKKIVVADAHGYGASEGSMISYVYIDKNQFDALYQNLYIGFFESVGNFSSWDDI